MTGVDQSEAMLTIAHFYGHLDAEQRERVQPVQGELVVVDSAFRGVAEDWQERVLNDGSRHRVYKRWFTADDLRDELGGGEILHAGPWFVAVRAPRRRS